jgi:ligand-binding sensor domain-containing protein
MKLKRIARTYLLALTIVFYSCKKETLIQKPVVQKPEENIPEWVNYNIANSALPDNQVNALSMAPNNTAWIATANGLARLKNTEWTIYNTTNTPLPSNSIQAVATEADGTVWVGTDEGLARYNGTQWTTYTTQNSVLTDNRIKCITHDARHKTTWIATEDGIVKVQNNTWTYIEVFNVILSIAVDHDGNLWTGEFNDFAFIGLIKKYQGSTPNSHRLDLLGYTSALPYSLAVDSKNRVVAALAGTVVKSVIRFDGAAWQEIDRPEQARGLKTLTVEGDRIWVGGATFSEFGDKSHSILTMPHTSFPIVSMDIDNKGRKWLGSLYDGVAVYYDKVKK